MLQLVEQQLTHWLRRADWQASRQLGLPLQPLLAQALTTTLLQAFWQAMMAALGQVKRSVCGVSWVDLGRGVLSFWLGIATSGSLTVDALAVDGEGAGDGRSGQGKDGEDGGGLHFGGSLGFEGVG